MPGAVTVTLLEANIVNKEHEISRKSNPYCLLSLGGHKIDDEVSIEGIQPKWGEPIKIDRTNEPYCFIKLEEKEKTETKPIWTCEIDLEEVEPKGQITKWYDIYDKDNLVGHILVETVFKSTQ